MHLANEDVKKNETDYKREEAVPQHKLPLQTLHRMSEWNGFLPFIRFILTSGVGVPREK